MFGRTEKVAQKAYVEFMAGPTPDETLRMLRDGVPEDHRVLGDDEWIHAVLEGNVTKAGHDSLDDIVRSACKRHAVTEAALASRSRSHRHSRIRAEIALTATEQGSATLTEVAKRFGRAHSGLSRAMNRPRHEAKK